MICIEDKHGHFEIWFKLRNVQRHLLGLMLTARKLRGCFSHTDTNETVLYPVSLLPQ